VAFVELLGDVLQTLDGVVGAVVERVISDQFADGSLAAAEPVNQGLNFLRPAEPCCTGWDR